MFHVCSTEVHSLLLSNLSLARMLYTCFFHVHAWHIVGRSYRSVGDEAFMRAFETATLGYEEWTHEVGMEGDAW